MAAYSGVMTLLEKMVTLAILLLCLAEAGSLVRGLKGKRLGRNLGFGTAALGVGVVLRHLHEWMAGLAVLHWGNRWLESLACVLVAELFGWTCHYLKHVHPWLWKFHFQHHREEEYNLWLTTHTHALEVLFSGTVMAALLAVCGFSNQVVGVYLLYYSLVKFFQHSSRDYRLGPLGYLIITPAYHRWHHEIESRCNYGVTLTLFDVLFGTVRWPDHVTPERYGVKGELPYGFWAEHLWFLGRSTSVSEGPRQRQPS